jgi:peptidoglycan/LPS O-acetylase OafA/YrhL
VNRLKAIDELRGLAVLIVMIVHIGAFSPFADFTPVRYVYPATE